MKKVISLLLAAVITLSCFVGMTFNTVATEPEIPEYANTNLALNAPVLTYIDECVEQWGNAVRHLTDGDRSTMFLSSMVQPVESVEYDWIMVDLGEERVINQVTLVAHHDPNLQRYYMFPTDYKLQISTDNEEWKTVAEYEDFVCDRFDVVHNFEAQPARYVRIYVTGVDTSVHNPPYWFVYLREFEVSYFVDNTEEYAGKSENVLTAPYNMSDWRINSNNGPVDYRAYINYDFDAFSFGIYVKASGSQDITFELYKWDTSLEKTLTGKNLVKSQKFTALEEGKTYKMEFDTPMPAGEYLFSIMDPSTPSSSCYLELYEGTDGTAYTAGECYIREELRTDIVPSLTIYTSDESYVEGNMFGIAPVVDPSTDTTAEETTVADTTAEDTTAEDTTAEDTTVSDTTVASVEETTATPTGDSTDAPEEGTASADATAGETTAAVASGCKASVGAAAATAAMIAVAGAVALKKKED